MNASQLHRFLQTHNVEIHRANEEHLKSVLATFGSTDYPRRRLAIISQGLPTKGGRSGAERG